MKTRGDGGPGAARLRARLLPLLRPCDRRPPGPLPDRLRPRPADLRLVVRLVPARRRELAEPVRQPCDLRAGRREPGLDHERPRARVPLHADHCALRPGRRLQRRLDPRARAHRIHRLHPLPPSHRLPVGGARGRLPLRLLELHARPAAGPPPHDGGVSPAPDGARGGPVRPRRARRARLRLAPGRPLRPPVLAVDRAARDRGTRPRRRARPRLRPDPDDAAAATAGVAAAGRRRSESRSSSPLRSSSMR